MPARVEVRGLRELQKQLNAIAETGGRPGPIMRRALRAAIGPVVQTARELVPADTGALRDNIQVSVRIPRTGPVAISGGMKISTARVVEEIDGFDDSYVFVLRHRVNASYRWHFIEFGRSAANVLARRAVAQKRGKRMVKYDPNRKREFHKNLGDGAVSDVPARPFIRPAWDMHRGRLIPVFMEYLRRGIAEASKTKRPK